MQRFKEPVHVFEGSRSDDMRWRIVGEAPVLQEEDIESSAEVTLDAEHSGVPATRTLAYT